MADNKPPATRRLSLELRDPSKVGDEWELVAVAVVAEGKNPIPGVAVQFYRGGREQDGPVLTDGQGRAAKEFLVGAGKHTIEAGVVETTIKDKAVKLIVAEVKPKPKPGKFIVRLTGEETTPCLNFQVLTTDDNPVADAIIRITPDHFYPQGCTVKTDQLGGATYRIRFAQGEKNRRIEAVVLGTSLSEWTFAFNPQQP